MKWKDIGNSLYTEKQFDTALSVYKLSNSITPDDEVELKRDIFSNISLLNLKLKDYHEAVNAATKCIQIDPTWHKV